ncbi:hypothetical protein [Microbacterium enclense]
MVTIIVRDCGFAKVVFATWRAGWDGAAQTCLGPCEARLVGMLPTVEVS